MYEFHWPTKTVIGEGTLETITHHLPAPSGNQTLLLTAPREPWAQPLIDKIRDLLLDQNWTKVVVFSEVEPNPSWTTVRSGIKLARESEITACIALGGGSVMDAAKVIVDRSGGYFLCTIPTTAGTGGEISPWAVISNLETREKESLISKWPDVTLLDPELTSTMPPQTTLLTGIDAFIHGLEAYLSSAANPITDALSLKGMKLVNQHLTKAIEDGQDLLARQGMLEGSLLTGAAMLHAGLGLMHAIGNVTGGLYHDLPHGLILIRCLDAVLDYNQPVSGEKYQKINLLVDEIQEIAREQFSSLSIPEVTIEPEDLSLLAERAAKNVNAETNPRPASPEEIADIVQNAFNIAT